MPVHKTNVTPPDLLSPIPSNTFALKTPGPLSSGPSALVVGTEKFQKV